MSDTTRKYWIAALAMILGLAAWACARFLRPRSDEERPPIVVYEGSIEFAHGHPWMGTGNRRWTPNHPGGRQIASFEAIVINRSDNTVCIVSAPTVTIDYRLSSGSTKSFSLAREQIGGGQSPFVPVLSTADVDVTHTGRRLRFGEAGFIRQVTAGSSCGPYEENRQIQVFIEFKY